MAVVIGVLVYGGIQLEEFAQNEFLICTFTLSLVGVAAAFSLVITVSSPRVLSKPILFNC